MINQQMVDRYYEMIEIRNANHGKFYLDDLEEFQVLCSDLLYDIMVENRDVFERLKDK